MLPLTLQLLLGLNATGQNCTYTCESCCCRSEMRRRWVSCVPIVAETALKALMIRFQHLKDLLTNQQDQGCSRGRCCIWSTMVQAPGAGMFADNHLFKKLLEPAGPLHHCANTFRHSAQTSHEHRRWSVENCSHVTNPKLCRWFCLCTSHRQRGCVDHAAATMPHGKWT